MMCITGACMHYGTQVPWHMYGGSGVSFQESVLTFDPGFGQPGILVAESSDQPKRGYLNVATS